MALSLMNFAVLGLSLLLVQLIAQGTYNIFFSPLRDIPGPFLAKVTTKWLTFVESASHRTETLHKLHLKYGTSIRVGPNEVSFSNRESIKELYGQQTAFMKAPFYDSMSLPPMGIVSLRKKAEINERKRLLAHVFAQSHIVDSEPVIIPLVEKFIKRVDAARGQPLNMLYTFRLFSFDVAGELFLGHSSGGLDSETPPQLLMDMDKVILLLAAKYNLPWLYSVVSRLPVPWVRRFCHAPQRLHVYGEAAFREYIARYGRDSGRRDLLTKMMMTKPGTGDTALTDQQMWCEVGNLVFAATDTTGSSLTYLFWELAKHPSWQERLRGELRPNLPSGGGLPTYLQIQELPVLDAVINESLRLHPAAPSSLKRETPAGGRWLDGRFIPEKTVVSMQCYTTHRTPSAFPNPEAFEPQRWLNDPKPGTALREEARELFMPFSKGYRVCIGQTLAIVEMKLITATLIMTYNVRLAPGTTEDSMSMTDHFLIIPKGGKCDLVFERA